MKLKITIEAVNDNDAVLATETGVIEDINDIGSGISQWVMETLIKIKMDGIFYRTKLVVPNMVDECLKVFGPVTLSTLSNDKLEPLGAVIGLKLEGTILHVRRLVEIDGERTFNYAKNEFEEEIIQVPSILLLVTDAAGTDITLKFIAFIENFGDKVEI